MKLADARDGERYTQQQVADYLGVSRPTYRKLEENPDLLTIRDAKRLAELFKVDVQDIFFGDDCSKTDSSDESN